MNNTVSPNSNNSLHIFNNRNTDRNAYSKYVVNDRRVVSRMPLYIFQDQLVEHFDIRFF